MALVAEVITMGNLQLLEIGVHWDARKALKWFVFSLKFDISFLLIKLLIKEGINRIFFPL